MFLICAIYLIQYTACHKTHIFSSGRRSVGRKYLTDAWEQSDCARLRATCYLTICTNHNFFIFHYDRHLNENVPIKIDCTYILFSSIYLWKHEHLRTVADGLHSCEGYFSANLSPPTRTRCKIGAQKQSGITCLMGQSYSNCPRQHHILVTKKGRGEAVAGSGLCGHTGLALPLTHTTLISLLPQPFSFQ